MMNSKSDTDDAKSATIAPSPMLVVHQDIDDDDIDEKALEESLDDDRLCKDGESNTTQ